MPDFESNKVVPIRGAENATDQERRPTLKSGGGGGTFDGMELVDAKIAAAEARTDAKFAELLGELKSMRAETSHLPSTSTMVSAVGLSVIAGVGVVLAALAFGGDRFDGGVAVGQAGAEAKTALDRVIAENEAQTRQIEQVSQQLQKVLFAISREPAAKQGNAPTMQGADPTTQMPLIMPNN